MLWLYPRNVAEALAIEEAILRLRIENRSPDTICFWRGKTGLVVGGDINRDKVDFNRCRELGIPIFRRQTGGGAIYQDGGNLNYSVILPLDGIFGEDPTTAGCMLDRVVAKAVSKIGLEAIADGGKICVKQRKISGSAQFVLWGYLLHHGVIAVSTDLEVLGKIIQLNKIPVTTLENELGRKISVEELVMLICDEFAQFFGTPVSAGELSDDEKQIAQELLKVKYLNPEWVGCLDGKG